MLPQATDLTVAEAAEKMRVTPAAVRAWVASGRIPGAYRVGRRSWRIPLAALDAACPAAQPPLPVRQIRHRSVDPERARREREELRKFGI